MYACKIISDTPSTRSPRVSKLKKKKTLCIQQTIFSSNFFFKEKNRKKFDMIFCETRMKLVLSVCERDRVHSEQQT